ncbi:MAG: hypothetical protein JRJ17_07630 [Deltaproteobacteria bacterium]|nr:hypothetical protein [Deltaproteobacteria bacterium]
MEPAYVFLEEHVYNFTTEEIEEIMIHLVRIEDEKDLQALGYKRNEEGIYILSPSEEPWSPGGES